VVKRKIRQRLNRISEHFTKAEFTCRCGCGQCKIDYDLVEQLEFIRNMIGLPVIVHCVNRCKEHNKNVGGVNNSQHIKGHAADFHVKGLSIKALHDIVRGNHGRFLKGGMGLYDWGVHIDTGRFRKWGE
jgi:uncharacterized protein YcbK (DUF882 family)